MKPLSKIFLILFFSAQIFGILMARFSDVKYFCWAPYDQLTSYQIIVRIDSVELSNTEIEERYHRSADGFENRNIHNLFHIIRQYETTYGKQDNAIVSVNYQTNGGDTEVWNWQQPETDE